MRKLSEKIGVVLATYNGERFLQEQLDCLVAQTVLPNRLVVCDDRSTDSTIAILEKFRNSAPFPVEIHINPGTLLPTENFFRAASLCPTDYVALCDQDDLWDKRKIELCDRMATISNPDLILHSVVDFVTDADGKMVTTDPRLVKDGVVAGTAANPALIWLGMAMVPHKRIFDDIPLRQALWGAHFDRLRAIGAESNQSHWWECHDLYLLYRLRESGRIGLIGDVLAHHRTFAGGWHSDPTPESLGPAS
ncbi:glycosyltransferase [Novosphingobium sp.]|uniref:glycosyltransferase n=1 Tax=Novosphingobium sp. TaxID=1874826 RepID=UPI0025D1AA0E|nr:glycosyltransferase [Novosphingobium sp.]